MPRLSELVAASVALMASHADALAFPGALGFGSIATGGNSGTTYTVTSLADSGTGTLRDAVSESNRNIVFDVGGYIVLESALSLSSDITINGQTAPGDGIGIMAAEVSASDKSNIIIRNVRMRQGTDDPDTGKSCFNMGDATNVILDHCSFAYGQWDTVDAVGAVNITVSNSVIAFPIGQQFGAHVETGPSTFVGNLWVSAHNRQPLAKDDTQFINNVIYNYQAGYTCANTGGDFLHDIMDNYFIAGPSTTSAGDDYYQVDSNQKVYAVGNYLDSNKDGSLNGAAANTVGSAAALSSPWASSSNAMASQGAAAAVASVLANAGASPRDEVDALAVSQTESYGTEGKIYGSQTDTGLSNGGYGTLTSSSDKRKVRRRGVMVDVIPPADVNGNAIADFWEEAHGLALHADSSKEAFGDSPFNNLIVYLSSLVLPAHWSASDFGNPVLAGASTYNSVNGLWVLTGSGENKAGDLEEGQFASRVWTSGADSSIKATVASVSSGGQAGLMVRGSDPHDDTAFVALLADDDGTVSLRSRSTDGGALAQAVAKTGFGKNVSLRLDGSGSAFRAYTSTDGGANWAFFGSATVSLGKGAEGGIVVTSSDKMTRATASFSHVEIDVNSAEL